MMFKPNGREVMRNIAPIKSLLALTLVVSASVALAQEELSMAGEQTSMWLSMQREGEQASTNPQAASAVQREKAAERFLKTYDYAIKESFYGDGFGAGK
jgi:hypothetical protein